jgi:hypothetical protein
MTGMNCSSEGTSSSSDLARDSDSAKQSHDQFTSPVQVPVQAQTANDTTEAAALAAVAAIAAEAVALGRRAAALGPPLASNQQDATSLPYSGLEKSLGNPLVGVKEGRSGSGSDKSGAGAAGDDGDNNGQLRSSSDCGRSSSSFGSNAQKRPKPLHVAASSEIEVDAAGSHAPDSVNGEVVPRSGQDESIPIKTDGLDADSSDAMKGENVGGSRKVQADEIEHGDEEVPEQPPEKSQRRESRGDANGQVEDGPASSASAEAAHAGSSSAPNTTKVKAEKVRA